MLSGTEFPVLQPSQQADSLPAVQAAMSTRYHDAQVYQVGFPKKMY